MEPIVYRLESSLRRCCWYGIATIPVFAAGLVWLPAKDGPRENPVAIASVLGAVAFVLLVTPLRWRVWIGERGVHRRVLGFATMWPWQDFEAGCIRLSEDGGLIHTALRWWNPLRAIHLETLEEAGRKAILQTLEPRLPPPEAVEPPDELSIAAGRRRIQLDDQGLHITDRQGAASHLWSEVHAIDIVQADTAPPRVDRIEVSLPESTLRLNVVKGHLATAWNKSLDAAIVADFLYRRVSTERYHVSWKGQQLANRALAERLAEEATRNLKELNWCFGLLSIAHLGIISWMAWDAQELLPLILLVPWLPMPWVWWAGRRHAHQWRDYLVGERWHSEPPPVFRL